MTRPARAALTLALYRGEALVRRETLAQDAVRVGRDAQGRLEFGLAIQGPPLAVIKVAPPLDAALHALGEGLLPSAALQPGSAVRLGEDRIVLEALLPAAALAAPGPRRADLTGIAVVVVMLSLGAHLMLLLGLVILAFLPTLKPREPAPPLSVHLVQAAAPAEPKKLEVPEPVAPEPPPPPPQAAERAAGAPHEAAEGRAGDRDRTAKPSRFGVQGPKDPPGPKRARRAALEEAAEFGMIGLLQANGEAGGGSNRPGAALGSDTLSAKGNLYGDSIGDAFGVGGLGLVGTGEGGGGRGSGIGLGSIGTLGHGSGTGQGYGTGRLGGRSSEVRAGEVAAEGKLPPEVIRRIVRAHTGRFRACYERASRSNPNLAGRVSVRFVIGRDGAVTSAADAGSSLPDPEVIACVLAGFRALSFPAPEAGVVAVTYPITFSSGR